MEEEIIKKKQSENMQEIAEMIKEAILNAVGEKVMANEVILMDASGVRVELNSNNTCLKKLTTKAHKSFDKLKANNGNKLIPVYCQ